MSLALIQESAREVRRLSIAGSPLALGDFRLKKLIPPLEQAGANVPVFAQVARAIADLVNGKEAESAANLLNLSTLLNAILYTQGQSGAEGVCQELDTFSARYASTKTSSRVLKPLIEALTSTGGGRFETVKAAVERGAFTDLRLIEPSIRALDDTYPELADLVAEKVLPSYGPGIVPLLKQKLDLKGKKSDARRLIVLHQLDPAGTIELCKTALEDGSAEVKAAAIACLGKHEECLPLVLEQVNSKNKMLRAAALEALAQHDHPEVTRLFTELIKGKTLELLARPFRGMRNQLVFNSLLAEGRAIFGDLLKGENEKLTRFSQILDCLEKRKDAEEFLLGSFDQCEKIARLKAPKNSQVEGLDVVHRLATLLYLLGSTKAYEAVLAKRQLLTPTSFGMVLRSALRAWPAEKIFQEFSPLLEEKKGAGKERREHLRQCFWAAVYRQSVFTDDELDELDDPLSPQIEWDQRWLDAAIKADEPLIVCCLAKPGHKAAVSYLLKALEDKSNDHPDRVIEALSRCQYPNVTRAFLDAVARRTKGAKYLDYELHALFKSARHLPAADLPELDAFAAGLDEKFVDKYLEALEPLRMAGQQKPAGE